MKPQVRARNWSLRFVRANLMLMQDTVMNKSKQKKQRNESHCVPMKDIEVRTNKVGQAAAAAPGGAG